MATVRIPKDWPLLLGCILVAAALYNHYMGHSAYSVELIFIAFGIVLAVYSLVYHRGEATVPGNGILVDLLSKIISRERSAVLIPLFGFLLVAIWSGWKILVSGQADLRLEDFVVTLFGVSLVLYNAGPSKYAMQKDFVVLYLMFLTIVFAVIWKTYTIVSGDSYYRINAYSEYYLINIPVVFIVRMFGIGVSSELDASSHGISNYITFEYHGRDILLGIGEGCSGLYSAGLFFSAFLAFVLVRYRKVDPWILSALGLGFIVTWASNIIRMAITIMIGSAYGAPALAFFHGYIGIIVFVVFVAIFWMLIVRWLDRVEGPTEPQMAEDVVTEGQEPKATD
jgi:exosortase/archaeosortase family protein